jgi:uncharacterized cofD-like protein
VSSASEPRVVALGGGHGLAASLTALRSLTPNLTAVVTVADDGGSSGRLRRDLDVLPPGDLRMALAALGDDTEWGRTWSRVVQHRFSGPGELTGHSVGNLLLVALWELADDDPVQGLDWMGQLVNAAGRVLPMATVPLEISATMEDASGQPRRVVGQVAVATADGRIVDVALEPADPPACPEAVAAVERADCVVLGPGSWFTSVIPHLLVPGLASALARTRATRVVVLNLEPQPGETSGFTPEEHLQALVRQAPGLRVDVVLVDPSAVADAEALNKAAIELGAQVLTRTVRVASGEARHDPAALARALAEVLDTTGHRPQVPVGGQE